MAVGYRSSSASGTSDQQTTSCSVPVPSGAAAGDIALLAIEHWEAFGAATTPPTGFTQIVSVESGPTRLRVWWKRLSGADTGNYTVTWTGSIWNMGHCILITGALASGDPIEATNTAVSASGTGIPSTTVTTVTEAFLAHFAANDNGGAATPPTGFTEVQDGDYIHTNYRIPGATGTQTASGGTIATSGNHLAALIAVKPDAGGSHSADATLSSTATVTTGAATTKPAAATLTTTATATPAASSTKPIAATVTETATITTDASATKPATASLTGTATITADAAVGAAPKNIDTSVTEAATIAATVATTKPVEAAVSATGSIDTAAQAVKPIAAAVAGTATIDAAASVEKGIAATQTVTASIAPTADVPNSSFICQDFTTTASVDAYGATASLVLYSATVTVDSYTTTATKDSYDGTAAICGR